MAEALGRFREVAGTVPREPGDIALQEGFVHLADGRPCPVQPSGKLLSGTKERWIYSGHTPRGGGRLRGHPGTAPVAHARNRAITDGRTKVCSSMCFSFSQG